MNKQAYALRKIGREDQYHKDFIGANNQVANIGTLGVAGKNIYDTYNQHDGSYLESGGRLFSGEIGGTLGGQLGSILGASVIEGSGGTGNAKADGALTAAVSTGGALLGQTGGVKGYNRFLDKVRENKKDKNEE